MIDLDRLAKANKVLASYHKHVQLVVSSGGRIACRWNKNWGNKQGTITKVWMTRGNDFFPVWHKKAPWGGTSSTSIAMLVRWVRGQSVLPLATWEYWASKTMMLCGEETLAILKEIGWPENINCVVCGKTPKGLDWWDCGKVKGPCCSFGRCDPRFKQNG